MSGEQIRLQAGSLLIEQFKPSCKCGKCDVLCELGFSFSFIGLGGYRNCWRNYTDVEVLLKPEVEY